MLPKIPGNISGVCQSFYNFFDKVRKFTRKSSILTKTNANALFQERRIQKRTENFNHIFEEQLQAARHEYLLHNGNESYLLLLHVGKLPKLPESSRVSYIHLGDTSKQCTPVRPPKPFSLLPGKIFHWNIPKLTGKIGFGEIQGKREKGSKREMEKQAENFIEDLLELWDKFAVDWKQNSSEEKKERE